jgi:hypothetical protein
MRFRYLLFLAFGLLLAACGTDATDAAVADETEAVQGEEMADRTVEPIDNTGTPGSNSYKIEVINADKASPRKEMSGTLASSKIIVNYGSPRVKGRVVFGELEPWGKVWRAGADEATVVTLEKDVMVEGKRLAAGSYAFFLIPNQDGDWTAIFNKEYEQWGAYEYNEEEDALRVTVAPTTAAASAEEMDFSIQDGQLRLHWDKTVVPITFSAV